MGYEYNHRCINGFWFRFQVPDYNMFDIQIYSSAGEPMIDLKMNYSTLEELFSKISSLYSGSNVIFATSLPLCNTMYNTILSCFATQDENCHVAISQVSVLDSRENRVNFVLPMDDLASIILDIADEYFEMS